MIIHGSKRMLMLAALLCTAMPSFAFEPPKLAQPPTCRKPEYPPKALKAGEEGINVVGILVRADGTVARTLVLHSSGSPDLDRTTADAFSRCLFTRNADSSHPDEVWTRKRYTWNVSDDPEMLNAKRAAALAANKGSLPALYHLSMLISGTAKTSNDRGKALSVLRSAAEMGHPHAQFDLGEHYEQGHGVEADLEKALHWYQKSAVQGDPLATQRLTLGMLPIVKML